MRGTLDLVERLGREVELSVHVGGVEVVAVAPEAEHHREGDRLELQVPLELVHVFAAGADDEDTARIGSPTDQAPLTTASLASPASKH
jgi:hypothetical protein